MEAQSSGWTIEEYVTARGENLVLSFLSGQSGKVKAEAIALLKLLKERGNTLGMPHSKSLGQRLFELRGTQVRIFYTFRPGRRITLLDGMLKKRDRMPKRTLECLKRFQKEVAAIQE
jgi:hypothetical protein